MLHDMLPIVVTLLEKKTSGLIGSDRILELDLLVCRQLIANKMPKEKVSKWEKLEFIENCLISWR